MKSDVNSPFFTLSRFALIFLVVLAGTSTMGQRYHARTYTETDGLANSMVYCIVQDTSGLLWMGRRLGITSYDGSTFTNYNITDGLQTGTYGCMFLDEFSRLWALPEYAPFCISKKEGTRWTTQKPRSQFSLSAGVRFNSLDVYYENGNAVILAGTSNSGVLLYSETRVKQITSREGLPANNIYSARSYENGIFIATTKALVKYDKGTLKQVFPDYLSNLPGIVYNIERSGNQLWLLGENWLGYINEEKFYLVSSAFKLTLTGIGWRCFLDPGRNGKIYFGNPYAIYYYTPVTGITGSIGQHNGLISDGASEVLVDRELNVWIAGYRGLTKISSERFASYLEKDGLYSNEVSSGIEASPGNYIFGHDGVLTFFDGKTMSKLILYKGGVDAQYEKKVLDIRKDKYGNVWLAANYLGVARLNKDRSLTWFREPQGLPGNAFSVCTTPEGDVYANTFNGLYKLKNGRFMAVHLNIADQLHLRKIFAGSDGSIYLGTFQSGIIHVTGDKCSVITSKDYPLANDVYALFTDSKFRKWVGTSAGLFEISGSELKRVNQDGLYLNRPVYLILEDHSGNIWFGTDNGVYRWNGAILDHFSVNDGLAGQDISRSAGFVDSKNHLWFGTNTGLTQYRPELDYKPGEVPPPKVFLQDIIAGTDTLDPHKNSVLPYNNDDLEFHARVISLVNEKQNFVKYYLEGSDTGWSHEQAYSGSSFIFNNLHPGSYRFHIIARNSLGAWSLPVVSATIKIQPPVWFRWWFITLAFLLIAGIVFIFARFILVSRYKNRLKSEVSLRTLELKESEKLLIESNNAKDSFFSIIAHDLRNPFNVILGYLDLLTCDDADYSEAEQKNILLKLKSASVRTIDLLENLLTWARSQRGSLPFDPEQFSLGEVISDNIGLFDAAAHSKNIALVVSGKQDVKVFADRNMINTVVRNLISNSIKFTNAGGAVTIDTQNKEKGIVTVVVKDNGVAISEKTMQSLFKVEHRSTSKGTANETGTGLGLILCKEFVEKNQGRIWVESEPGKGTTFCFTIPKARAHGKNPLK